MEKTILRTVVEGYLTVKRVMDIFEDCLFKEHEIENGKPITDPLIVQGIMGKFGFHPERIYKHRLEIEILFSNLSEKCSEGVSFLCLCYDKYNHLWTGSHSHVEQLVSLGLATGIAEYCAPMEMWPALPGGVPYIRVNFEGFLKPPQEIPEGKKDIHYMSNVEGISEVPPKEDDLGELKKIWDEEILQNCTVVTATKQEVSDVLAVVMRDHAPSMKKLEEAEKKEKKEKKVKKSKLEITKYVAPGVYIGQKNKKKEKDKPKALPVKLTRVAQVAKKKVKTKAKTGKKKK
jgi:hypothetical protein